MKNMKTEPEHHFEQVDGLAFMGEDREIGLDRWVERTEGTLWGVLGAAVAVSVSVLAVVAVLG